MAPPNQWRNYRGACDMPPHIGQVPPRCSPHMEIVFLKNMYSKPLSVPSLEITCPPGCPPNSRCLVTPLPLILPKVQLQSLKNQFSIKVDGVEIKSIEHVRNLGIIFDKGMTMEKQIKKMCQNAYFNIRNLLKLRKNRILSECCLQAKHLPPSPHFRPSVAPPPLDGAPKMGNLSLIDLLKVL